MSCPDLHSFLAKLRHLGLLQEVQATVDPSLELAEIHRRIIEDGGPALLFRSVKGSPFPVVTNLFGTKERAELAFGREGLDLLEQLAKLPEELFPISFSGLWKKRHLLSRLARTGFNRLKKAPIFEVELTPPQLNNLPLLTSWPLDGGPFVTLPLVYTEHPSTRVGNLGMYRLQRFSSDTLGLHFQIAKGGGYHLAEALRQKQSLPVSVSIGGPPLAIMSAIAPLPENVPELLLCSLLLGQKLRLGAVPDFPLPVLADAEFAIVGESDPSKTRPEGPFGDHYGYYSLEHDFPFMRCRSLYHRKQAIYPATVVGKPRQEDFFIGEYLQRLLSPLFPLAMPTIKALWSYGETGFHSLATAVVHDRYHREAMVSAFRVLGEGQLTLTKFLFVIDKSLDIQNIRLVLEHVLARADFRRDFYILSNLSLDTLDYTGPKLNEGSRAVMLGLGEPIRELPQEFAGPLPLPLTAALKFSAGCLVISGPSYKQAPELAAQVSQMPEMAAWPLVIISDDAKKATSSNSEFLWQTFTRFNPATDIKAASQNIVANHLCYSSPLVIDSRMKPNYPEEVSSDEDTRKLVDRRWREYW